VIDETFVFDWTKAPLSLNHRTHRQVERKVIREIRQEMAARAAHLPAVGRVDVALVWVVADARRRDEENVVATLKPLCDGLVDAGLVPDDTPEFMVKRMPEIRLQRGVVPHFELHVREVAPIEKGVAA